MENNRLQIAQLIVLMLIALVSFGTFIQVTPRQAAPAQPKALPTAGSATNFTDVNVTGEIDAATGNITSLTAATVSAPVLGYGSTGKKIVCGTDTVTGTLAIAHGLATPSYAVGSLAGDVSGDVSRLSISNAAKTVTVKVWNSAATPAANATGVAVNWCVVGQ